MKFLNDSLPIFGWIFKEVKGNTAKSRTGYATRTDFLIILFQSEVYAILVTPHTLSQLVDIFRTI